MKKNKILIIFILIGIISSVVLSFNRMKMEKNNKTVDITLDLVEIKKLANQSEEDINWWLRKFKEWGASSVTLNEETFESMIEDNKPIRVEMLGNAIKDIYWKDKYPRDMIEYLEKTGIDQYDVIAVTNSESLYTFIEKGLRDRYDEEKYNIFKSETEFIFLLDGNEKDALFTKGVPLVTNYDKPFMEKKELAGSKLIRLGLGYDDEKVNMIKDSGLDLILRAMDYNPNWVTEKYIEANFNEYKRLNIEPKYMLFSGEQVLGYPGYIKLTREFMEKNNIKIGLIESGVQRGHIAQDGVDELAEVLDYNAVRVFSVAPYIQERFKFYNYSGAEEIENTLYRAVTERNIRLIYFRPFKIDSYTYVIDPIEYEKTFTSFESRIGEHGMSLGEGSVFSLNIINPIFKVLIGLGILGGGIIILEGMFSLNERLKKLLIILGIPSIAVFPFVFPNFSVIIYAMVAAIIFPTLSMIYFCKIMKVNFRDTIKEKTLKQSILIGGKTLGIMCLISSIGALFVASLLSSTDYLLEMRIFRGVKIVQLLPILLYIVTFLGYFGYKKDKSKEESRLDLEDIKEILFDNIKVFFVLLSVFVLGIGYIYLARTGHETNIQPSNLEMIGRNFLELKLLARPRIKEFTMAFPAVILAVYAVLYRQKLATFIIGLLIVIGQTSIVNTFTHLRTPMYLSIIRTFYGLVFGLVLGIVYVILLDLGVKLINTLRGELFNE